jgi:uncharacterized protein involved in exopolysaccharide biosynthesis
MTEKETALLNQFSAPAQAASTLQTGQADISFLEIIASLLRHKKMVGFVALVTTSLAVVPILLWPPFYVSQAVILPPQQSQSSIAALASGAIGTGLGGIGSQLGLKNPADLYIAILKSRSLADEIIAKFDLQKIYKKKLLSDTRKKLQSRAIFTNSKESAWSKSRQWPAAPRL